ncbi:MAG: phospholipase D-like domain-containing protein [Pseudomonadota bacterium]
MNQSVIVSIVFICLLFLTNITYAVINTPHQVCFFPEQACLAKITQTINAAKKSIYLQASNLTSDSITRALVNARAKGIKVRVLLDKSQWQVHRYSASRYLVREGIPVWIDFHEDFANTNLLIVDNKKVVLGGLNYHENQSGHISDHVLFIDNKTLANIYLAQWQVRKNAAKRLVFPVRRYGQDHRGVFSVPTAVKVFMQIGR